MLQTSCYGRYEHELPAASRRLPIQQFILQITIDDLGIPVSPLGARLDTECPDSHLPGQSRTALESATRSARTQQCPDVASPGRSDF